MVLKLYCSSIRGKGGTNVYRVKEALKESKRQNILKPKVASGKGVALLMYKPEG